MRKEGTLEVASDGAVPSSFNAMLPSLKWQNSLLIEGKLCTVYVIPAPSFLCPPARVPLQFLCIYVCMYRTMSCLFMCGIPYICIIFSYLKCVLYLLTDLINRVF